MGGIVFLQTLLFDRFKSDVICHQNSRVNGTADFIHSRTWFEINIDVQQICNFACSGWNCRRIEIVCFECRITNYSYRVDSYIICIVLFQQSIEILSTIHCFTFRRCYGKLRSLYDSVTHFTISCTCRQYTITRFSSSGILNNCILVFWNLRSAVRNGCINKGF